MCFQVITIPFLFFSRSKSISKILTVYAFVVCKLLRFFCGVSVEVRGKIPNFPCIIATRHESFLDPVVLHCLLSDPIFIAKSELKNFLGFSTLLKLQGTIFVNRDKKNKALRVLKDSLSALEASGRKNQIIIFPQGARDIPCTNKPYQRGIELIRKKTLLPIISVAVNSGLFWPSKLNLYPGKTVIEFLPALTDAELACTSGLTSLIEEKIEIASRALFYEAALNDKNLYSRLQDLGYDGSLCLKDIEEAGHQIHIEDCSSRETQTAKVSLRARKHSKGN